MGISPNFVHVLVTIVIVIDANSEFDDEDDWDESFKSLRRDVRLKPAVGL